MHPVEELHARIARKTSINFGGPKYRYAFDEDLEIIRKPKPERKWKGIPPWEARANTRRRWEQMDEVDRAKVIEMRQRNAAIEMAKAKPEPPQNIVDGDVYCIDCDTLVGKQRLEAKPNASRCIDCQQIHEIKERN